MNYLDHGKLAQRAPSIFATSGAEKTSEKYGFIPTIDCIRGLELAGFYPVDARQSRCRIEGKENHTKHVIRFRKEGVEREEGVIPEIVMINSHDGSSSYQLRAGLYRFVCCNGLIVGTDYFTRRIKHSGDVISKVVEAANDLIELAPISVQKVEEWKGIHLTRDQKSVYAQSAAMLKWDPEQFKVDKISVLRPKRYDDTNSDLWTTFNVIQENMLRGGVSYRNEEGNRRHTRAVNAVTENVRLNTALWNLTEKMALLAK